MLFRLSSLYIRHCSFPRRLRDDTVCPDRAPLSPSPPHPAAVALANTLESLSAIFGALTPLDFLRAQHINDIRNGADFNPRSGFRRRRFLPVYLESRSPVRIPESLNERVQLFVRYFRSLLPVAIFSDPHLHLSYSRANLFPEKNGYILALFLVTSTIAVIHFARTALHAKSMDKSKRLDLRCTSRVIKRHCLSPSLTPSVAFTPTFLHTFPHGINKINGKIESYTLVEHIGRNRSNRALNVRRYSVWL